jgi:hypothetical protein
MVIKSRNPGLRPLTAEDKDNFFGREEEFKEIVDLINKNISIVIFGKSGIGKSSLINARVIPFLTKNRFITISIRINFFSNINPSEQLKQAISYYTNTDISTEGLQIENNLLEPNSVYNAGKENKLALIFDQFEEIFYVTNRIFQRQFILEIENLFKQNRNKQNQDLKMIFSVREDFLPELEELSKLIPELIYPRLRIKPFTDYDAKTYLLNQNILDERSIDLLVNELSSDPIFSYDDINSTHSGKRKVDFATLQMILYDLDKKGILENKGKARNYIENNKEVVSSLFEEFLNSISKSLDPSYLNFIAENLISKSKTRILVEFNDLASITSKETIHRLIDSRILISSYDKGKNFVSVSHDAFIDPIISLNEKIKKNSGFRKIDNYMDEFEKIRLEVKEKIKNKRGNSKYDIAISFAGEDREITKEIAILLNKKGVDLFFDEFQKAKLFGKNLYDYLSKVYNEESKYCLMIISKYYVEKEWTGLERESAQARA